MKWINRVKFIILEIKEKIEDGEIQESLNEILDILDHIPKVWSIFGCKKNI